MRYSLFAPFNLLLFFLLLVHPIWSDEFGLNLGEEILIRELPSFDSKPIGKIKKSLSIFQLKEINQKEETFLENKELIKRPWLQILYENQIGYINDPYIRIFPDLDTAQSFKKTNEKYRQKLKGEYELFGKNYSDLQHLNNGIYYIRFFSNGKCYYRYHLVGTEMIKIGEGVGFYFIDHSKKILNLQIKVNEKQYKDDLDQGEISNSISLLNINDIYSNYNSFIHGEEILLTDIFDSVIEFESKTFLQELLNMTRVFLIRIKI